MVLFTKLIGVFIVGAGILFIVRPDWVKSYIAFLNQEKRLYGVGVVRIVFGLILLFAAPHCKLPAIITAIGIIMLISGTLFFTLGLEKIKKIIAWYETLNEIQMRFMMIAAILFGGLILYAA